MSTLTVERLRALREWTQVAEMRAALDELIERRENAPQSEPLRAAVESFVASVETHYTPKGAAPRLHGCPMCDPLNPWNESDTDASGPTREQFTHWPECKIGKLKAALAADKSAIRKPGAPG